MGGHGVYLDTLPHVSMGGGVGAGPSSFPFSLPLLLARSSRGAEGSADWRASQTYKRTKDIWQHVNRTSVLNRHFLVNKVEKGIHLPDGRWAHENEGTSWSVIPGQDNFFGI
jgi:hypothetical protein